MQEMTVRVPEEQYTFFMELMRNLGFVEIVGTSVIPPESHQKLTLQRKANIKEEELLDWDEVKGSFVVSK